MVFTLGDTHGMKAVVFSLGDTHEMKAVVFTLRGTIQVEVAFQCLVDTHTSAVRMRRVGHRKGTFLSLL